MEDMVIFPGTMKLEGEAGTPKTLTDPGVEKSSISLLKMIPVLWPRTLEPKLKQKIYNIFKWVPCVLIELNLHNYLLPTHHILLYGKGLHISRTLPFLSLSFPSGLMAQL